MWPCTGVVLGPDPIERIVTCPLQLKAPRANLCPLHRKLDDAIATVERVFGRTTLEQLAIELKGGSAVSDELAL